LSKMADRKGSHGNGKGQFFNLGDKKKQHRRRKDVGN